MYKSNNKQMKNHPKIVLNKILIHFIDCSICGVFFLSFFFYWNNLMLFLEFSKKKNFNLLLLRFYQTTERNTYKNNMKNKNKNTIHD